MAEHAGYHEPMEWLDSGTVERHRAIVSLMEELEAVDWYDPRVTATTDDSLRAVLAHNRDEEKEHAAMTGSRAPCAVTLGQDASIGYLEPGATRVRLYLEKTFTFQVVEPEAAVHLAYD